MKAFLIILGFSFSFSVWAEEKPASSLGLQESFRKAVGSARSKLGDLHPWQNQLFQSEVLPFSESFVREYRPQGTGYQVDVDTSMIRNYLAFFAPKALAVEKPQFLVFVEPSPNCPVCHESVPSLKKLIESRLTTRGVQLVFIQDKELAPLSTKKVPPSTSGFVTLDRLKSLQATKGMDGVAAFRLEPMMVQDDESGLEIQDADRRLLVTFGVIAGKFKDVRKLELAATDSIQSTSRKLILESLGSLGAQVLDLETRALDKNEGRGLPEVLVSVKGVRDYGLFLNLKTALQSTLGELEPVLERRMTRGTVVFAIQTKLSGQDLKEKLQGILVGSQKLSVGDVLEAEGKYELQAKIQ